MGTLLGFGVVTTTLALRNRPSLALAVATSAVLVLAVVGGYREWAKAEDRADALAAQLGALSTRPASDRHRGQLRTVAAAAKMQIARGLPLDRSFPEYTGGIGTEGWLRRAVGIRDLPGIHEPDEVVRMRLRAASEPGLRDAFQSHFPAVVADLRRWDGALETLLAAQVALEAHTAKVLAADAQLGSLGWYERERTVDLIVKPVGNRIYEGGAPAPAAIAWQLERNESDDTHSLRGFSTPKEPFSPLMHSLDGVAPENAAELAAAVDNALINVEASDEAHALADAFQTATELRDDLVTRLDRIRLREEIAVVDTCLICGHREKAVRPPHPASGSPNTEA
jgi:hypothetical protein